MEIDPARVVAFDTETHLIQDGLAAPPGVCGSWSDAEGDHVAEFPVALSQFERMLLSNCIIAGAHLAYDLAVCAATPKGGRWTGNPDLLPLMFEKLERGEVWDVLIGCALDAVAGGHLFKDPKTFQDMRHPPRADGKAGRRAKRYTLDIVSRFWLGKHNAKENDEYRKKYFDLEWLSHEQWPAIAVQYPKDDSRNTRDLALEQIRKARNCGQLQRHPWTHMAHQTRAAFSMHLGSVWGVRTHGPSVDAVAERVDKKFAEDIAEFKGSGIIRENGKKDTAILKRLVIQAYGGGAPCDACAGSGKVPSPVNPRNKINCKVCGGAGLALPDALPLTEKGGVSCSRDTLAESGNDLLEAFSEVSMNNKLRQTYLPFLRTGTSRPINVSSNPLVETCRASYDGIIQLVPRGGGIRECFIPRRREFIPDLPPGCEDQVLDSVDYSAVELCTLAQVCLWVVGWSRMAEVINASKDPGALHTHFGAKLIGGVDPAEFTRRVKAGDKDAKDKRQAAKAANFGFPGLMGAAKLTITKRKEGLRFCILSGRAPPCEICQGEIGKKCRRCYGRGFLCGIEKVTEWYGRPIPPTCPVCIEYAAELKRDWLEQWPEINEYFEWVKSHDGVSDGLGEIVSPGTGYVRSRLNPSAMANHSFQHLAAMGAKHALWKVSKECYTDRNSPLYGCRPLFFAHDEIVSEHPESRAHEAGYRKAEIMIAAMREFTPDVHISAEPAIMRRWYKEAETVKDPRSGRLVTWEPPCPRCKADGIKKACKPECDVKAWPVLRFAA